MSFILVPKRGDDLQVNAWNWRPMLELLLRERLVSNELYDRMGAQGAGGEVEAELAEHMAEAIRRTLKAMNQGVRKIRAKKQTTLFTQKTTKATVSRPRKDDSG